MNGKIVLGIGAHPDDLDFTAAGSIAKWVEEGASVYYLIATDGSKGSDDPTMTEEHLIKIRRKEQSEAANILGVKEVFFLDHPDTELQVTQQLKEEIVRVIRKLRPDVVVTLSSQLYFRSETEPNGYVNHTDHRAIAVAATDAVFPLARDRLTFPSHEAEGLQPWKAKELYIQNLEAPDFVVDISTTFGKKLAALSKHTSQFKDFEKSKERLKKRAAYYGKIIGAEYGENFTRIVLP